MIKDVSPAIVGVNMQKSSSLDDLLKANHQNLKKQVLVLVLSIKSAMVQLTSLRIIMSSMVHPKLKYSYIIPSR